MSEEFGTIDEWIEFIDSEENICPIHMIPNEKMKQEYIKNVSLKSDEEVKSLLRILLSPYTRQLDILNYNLNNSNDNINDLNEDGVENWENYFDNIKNLEVNHRINNGQEAWEGLTWVLELLPYNPYKAIEALGTYLDAEIGVIPDERIWGISDCIDIIEQKYIYDSQNSEALLKLKPREFEKLIEVLYKSLGYDTELTPETRDGGKDVIARIKRQDGFEEVYIECKRYKTTKLSKDTVRSLGYVIQDSKATRGVIFCTGYASEKLKDMDKRIQIWTIEEINFLLNANLGSNWTDRLEYLIK
ncbi:MAG: restriction endonuclease [Paraclostridium sordellii]